MMLTTFSCRRTVFITTLLVQKYPIQGIRLSQRYLLMITATTKIRNRSMSLSTP